MTNSDIAHLANPHPSDGDTGLRPCRLLGPAAAKGLRRSLWEIQKSGLGDRGDSRILPASFALPQQSLRNSP